MKKTINRWIAAVGNALTSESRKQRADRFVAWLAGSGHERSMNG